MKVTKITCKQKCALYERILKYLTGAREIRVNNLMRKAEYGFVELVDVDPDDLGWHGVDEGLHLDYNSEIYMEDYGGVIKPRRDSRIIVEVWYGMDPWAEIKRLEKQIQSLSERAKDHE